MSKDFETEITRLIEMVPESSVEGHLVVDQVYAHYQHEGLEFKHPGGGQAMFLREPLYQKIGSYMRHLAKKAVTSIGVEVVRGMEDNMEDLAGEVYDKAPVDMGDLRNSGHPFVVADGDVVYDRPAVQPRLSDEELRAKGKLRYLRARR